MRVVVAMSGGVDSSVAAALLAEAGHEVIGVTLQIWPGGLRPPGRHVGCCSIDAVEDARRVADRLGIAHYVFNFQELFERAVIGPFTRAYLDGQTPNPCIWCNERVKFGALLDRAVQLGADALATGHYARVERASDGSGRYLLLRPKDRAKDQTYALWPLTQRQLERVVFPLAPYTKQEVREIARKLRLPVASKPESQEICFIPDDDYRRYLREHAPEAQQPGEIVDTTGHVLGRHPGVAFFTVGQRKGLGLAAGRPLYVVAVDPASRRVVVGDRREAQAVGLIGVRPNWIARARLEGPMRVEARIRRMAADAPATIEPAPAETGAPEPAVRCHFDEPQWAVTPGQSVVFYRGDVVIGGAVIRRGLVDASRAAHTTSARPYEVVPR
ncbi:tRNA 2-thiouridine(34) synthase MnmA [Carboxydochorda subterranea]|uniref:tRNA-specific 2-thiouridylase MnmA n=1 Tax=Carboxydichorda subterranea TaxID=3109565 RepID=A0ABZ1C0C4_9FIRM|nr:tRNA 2-thiouridine(34) synthase MnmA [Limnochorda sp. L945t]WRP18305.1 tRNA 2-thiouridine(34) synthase MnmA [Limnochorda sp. L945t]